MYYSLYGKGELASYLHSGVLVIISNFPTQKRSMFMKIKRKHCKLSKWSKGPGLKLFQPEKMLRNLLEEFVIISLLQAKLYHHCLLWKWHHSLAVVGWKVNYIAVHVLALPSVTPEYFVSLSWYIRTPFLHLWEKSGVTGSRELRPW
jgi:hypothetical protein